MQSPVLKSPAYSLTPATEGGGYGFNSLPINQQGATGESVVVEVLDDGTTWSRLKADFEHRLPLRQLFWQATGSFARGGAGATSASGPAQGGGGSTLRTIPCLDVTVKPFTFDAGPRSLTHQYSCFLYIFFTSCEDIELYRTSVRKQIQEWHTIISKKFLNFGIEYLIVHVPKSDPRLKKNAINTIFNLGIPMGGAAVLEKLKTDFPSPNAALGSTGKERVLQLKLNNPSPQDDEQAWAFFFSRIREAILSSFSFFLLQAEDDARRLDSQRLVPGWNYCQYFIMKESIALTFERMGMPEEALLHYEELEAEFFQTMAEQGAPWFKKFGGTDLRDDSASIFDIGRKRYRELIIQSSIPIFDFRIYLFARQAYLQRRIGPVPFLVFSSKFISGFSASLREYEVSLIPLFTECWIWSGCLYLLEYCDYILHESDSGKPLNQALLANNSKFFQIRAEILHKARVQLDVLGMHFGLLSHQGETLGRLSSKFPGSTTSPLPSYSMGSPNSVNLLDDSPHQSSEAMASGDLDPKAAHFSDPVLVKICQSEEEFDLKYKELTCTTILAYKSCVGRERAISALRSDLGYLCYLRGQYAQALEHWESVDCAVLLQSSWTPLLVFLPYMALCALELGQLKKFVLYCLLFFTFSYINPIPAIPAAHVFCIFIDATSSLLDTLSFTAESDSAVADVISSIRLIDLWNDLSDDLGSCATVRLTSRFPIPITVESISLFCSDQSEFSSKKIKLSPGSNDIVLLCTKKLKSGMYSASRISFVLSGGITISRDLTAEGSPLSEFKIHYHYHAIDIAALTSPVSNANSVIDVLWTLTPRFHPILDGRLEFEIPFVNYPEFITHKTSSQPGEEIRVPCEASNSGSADSLLKHIQLPDCQPGEQLEFHVTFDRVYLNRTDLFRLPIHLTFSVSAESGERRSLCRTINCNASGDPRVRGWAGLKSELKPTFSLKHGLEHDASAMNTLVLAVTASMPAILLECRACDGDLTPLSVPQDKLCLTGQSLSALFLVAGKHEAVESYLIQIRYQLISDVVDARLSSLLHSILSRNFMLQYSGYFFRLKERLRERVDLGVFTMTNGDLSKSLLVSSEMREQLLVTSPRETELLHIATEFLDSALASSDLLLVSYPTEEVYSAFTYVLDYNIALTIPEISAFVELVACSSLSGIDGSSSKSSSLASATIGVAVPFVVRITPRSRKHGTVGLSDALRIDYSFVIDGMTWMLLGKCAGHVTLEGGEAISFQINLIPLSSGALSLPRIVCNGPCFFQYASDQLLVLPQQSCTFRL